MMNGSTRHTYMRFIRATLACVALLVSLFALSADARAQGKDCSGTFTVTLPDGRSFSGPSVRTTVTIGGGTARARGKFVSFDVNLSTFQVTNYTLNSAITGNRPAVIFAGKNPLHGRTLTGALSIEINSEQMVLRRSDGALDMKIQAKDCSEGGIFQMEPEADFTNAIEFEHQLGPEFVYCVDSLGRALIVSATNPFIGRESPELATRSFPAGNAIVGAKISRWLVQNGGRMGMVTGEDAVQPLASACSAGSTPTPTPTATPSPTPTATPSPTPNATPSPTPNATPSPTPGATPSPTPTPGATPSPTPTPGATPSPTPVLNEIEAKLTGAAINGVVPKGDAEFSVEANGREFRVRVEQVNLPAGTVLRALVDNQFIGNITVAANLQRSELKLKTEDGQTVPQINSRSRVVVTDQAGATLLAGSFANNAPSPGPAPMPTPDSSGRLRIEARLAGAAINGLTPSGHARFRKETGRRDFNVEVERVNLPAGTILAVFVDGVKLGDIVLRSTLENELELNTNDGDTVPDLTTASTVVITNAQGRTILSGVFNTAAAPIANRNDIDDTMFFVEQQYRDFFGREADDSGLGFWSSRIAECNGDVACVERSRVNTSGAFFLSIEFQETGYMLYRFNKASYGVMPRRNQFLVDMQAAAQGVVVGAAGWQEKLEANKRAAAEAWVARAEFRQRYDALTNAQYVEALFQNANVAPTQAERDALVAGLNSGAETRATALRKVSDNAQFRRQENNPAFVLMQYFGYLHRNPDEGPDTNMDGFNFWLSKLNEFGGDFHRAEMVRAFISAGEYRRRFDW